MLAQLIQLTLYVQWADLISLLCYVRIMQILCNALSDCTGWNIEELDPLCIFDNNKMCSV